MRSFTWNQFPIKIFADRFFSYPRLESIYMHIDMCKFESSQTDESWAQLADSWNAYRKPRALLCWFNCNYWMHEVKI